MPPRRRQQFTQENIDQQLQQIHLLDQSSSSENLEQLGPIIKQIHTSRQQEAFLRTVQGLIEAKDAEIERICRDNYQDFISSVQTLFTVKSYTDRMKENIASLDTSVSQLGRGLVEKKRSLLQHRKTAANLDEAIDTLQACLRVLDVVDRKGEMVKEGKYWSALRSLEDIRTMPPSSLSQTSFFQHLLSSLPSLRAQIKDAVTASMKQWLLEIRNVSTEVGRLAAETMEARIRRWKTRREKDFLLRPSTVGSAVEMITYEKNEFNVLENDTIRVDFKPLFECIHIYTTLNSLDELRKSYQADRKAQAGLILPNPLPLSSLPSLLQEISGFFILENHVLETTGDFRSQRDVEELWDSLSSGLRMALAKSLRVETDPEEFFRVKASMDAFIMTLETSSYSTETLQSFLLELFETYIQLLEAQCGRRFEAIIDQDDYMPMQISAANEVSALLDVAFIGDSDKAAIEKASLPHTLPWSQSFYLCCQDIRGFIRRVYTFMDGLLQHHRNLDDLLNKALDRLLVEHISEAISKRLAGTQTLSQIAQVVTNLEYFQTGCLELELSLADLRANQRSGSLERIKSIITSKLDQFFELSEYKWTPQKRDDSPSMYLYELINWLTTVVDSLVIKDDYKDEAYKGALGYIAECLMTFLTGREIPMMNENAISNVLIDVDFLEDQVKRIGRAHLSSVFVELRLTTSIPLTNTVNEYLIPAMRHTAYSTVKHKRLQALLEKLARYGATQRDPTGRELAERRRKEADAVGRLFPGEGR